MLGEYKSLHSPVEVYQSSGLAKKSWSSYHHAHYEADNEGYQDENDERLRIDEHSSYPFSAGPDGLEKEQSINRDNALYLVDAVTFTIYKRSKGSSL